MTQPVVFTLGVDDIPDWKLAETWMAAQPQAAADAALALWGTSFDGRNSQRFSEETTARPVMGPAMRRSLPGRIRRELLTALWAHYQAGGGPVS